MDFHFRKIIQLFLLYTIFELTNRDNIIKIHITYIKYTFNTFSYYQN